MQIYQRESERERKRERERERNDMSELENDISVLESVLRRSKIECTTVRLREMGTELMGTILRFASVPPRKMGTLLLGSWWP